jgi:hypothetical protein
MMQVRAMPPTDGQARLWVQIANSDKYSDIRRRRAVLLFFERHVYSGMMLMTVTHFQNTPAFPTWFKKDNVHIVRDPDDNLPIDRVSGETIFVITPEFSSLDKATKIYLRVQGSPSVGSFYKVFGHDDKCWGYNGKTYYFQCRCGRESKVETLKITAIGISPNDDDKRLFDTRTK